MPMVYPRIEQHTLSDRNLAIEAFGHRLYADQTVYEYLIEFLLVLTSPKRWGESDNYYEPFRFPRPVMPNEFTEKLHYYPIARVGLKRFIFFERSKQENRFTIDRDAYLDLMNDLETKVNCRDELFTRRDVLCVLQDLFYGFNAVIKNRAWFAQSLLPIAPELVFCEVMGNKSKRKPMRYDRHLFSEIDNGFEFNGHYFLARGGEIYFLHLLRGLVDRPDLQIRLESGFEKLVGLSFPQLQWLANWIERNWFALHGDPTEIRLTKSCEWIPEGYCRRSSLSCEEIAELLDAEIPELDKIDILAKGVVLQVLRMMHEQSAYLTKASFPSWIIEIGSEPRMNIRKYSVESYIRCEEQFAKALDIQAQVQDEEPLEGEMLIEALKNGADHSYKLFRKIAKDIGLVIPPKGAQMRFSLNEDLIKFLVLSIVKPGRKILLSTFLEKLYDRFGMVIGPVEAERADDIGILQAGEFDANRVRFQDLLKQCGFLRDLSDATAIVENPFGGIFQ